MVVPGSTKGNRASVVRANGDGQFALCFDTTRRPSTTRRRRLGVVGDDGQLLPVAEVSQPAVHMFRMVVRAYRVLRTCVYVWTVAAAGHGRPKVRAHIKRNRAPPLSTI